MNILSTKAHYLLLFITLFAINSCNDDEIVYPEGGYKYPNHAEDKDTTFYCYPLKDIKSTRDSFQSANFYYFLKVFDEYNLSIKQKEQTTFRLIVACAMGGSSIITLTPSDIIVKRQTNGWTAPYPDTTKLTEKERMHFQLLQNWFPLNDTGHKKWRKIYLDSMTNVYPELLDPNYYRILKDKSADFGKEEFKYSLTRIPVTTKEFQYLVNKINKSGYWNLPYEVECKNMPMDGCAYILEANTRSKYNILTRIDCPYDTSAYVKACQELVNQAKMQNEISLVWDFEKYPRDYVPSEKVKVKELQLEDLKPEPKKKNKKDK